MVWIEKDECAGGRNPRYATSCYRHFWKINVSSAANFRSWRLARHWLSDWLIPGILKGCHAFNEALEAA